MKVLHITAHLGGGVGKALSGLATQTAHKEGGEVHTFVCLEELQKYQFVKKIRDAGCEVLEKPDQEVLLKLVADTDVLQVEWWNHPATIKCLCELTDIPLRLLVWSHVSGIHTPIIPKQLIVKSDRFLFTSKCSYNSLEVKDVFPDMSDKLAVVSSCGGFEEFPYPGTMAQQFSVGYIGSFNFSKLHPRFVEFLSAVDIPEFQVKMIGDLTNKKILEKQCSTLNREGMLIFRGYQSDVVSELSSICVMPYLLNPEHYGTTENALIETMSMGIVPVVLDNPAEKHIVDHNTTGLIVHTPTEFAQALHWLYENPSECAKLGKQAAQSVRQRFSANKMKSLLSQHYQLISCSKKRKIDFSQIFGDNPSQWFLSCQKEKDIFSANGSVQLTSSKTVNYFMFEKSKGSVFHFRDYFPGNIKLRKWSQHLEFYHHDFLNM